MGREGKRRGGGEIKGRDGGSREGGKMREGMEGTGQDMGWDGEGKERRKGRERERGLQPTLQFLAPSLVCEEEEWDHWCEEEMFGMVGSGRFPSGIGSASRGTEMKLNSLGTSSRPSWLGLSVSIP